MLNCTELDETLAHTHAFVVRHPVGGVVTAVCLILAGLVLVAYGERVIRLTGTVIGGTATLVLSYAVLAHAPLACEWRVGIAAALAVVVALAVSCVLKSGVFLVGAAGLAGVTHVVYDALPAALTRPTTSFQLADRSGFYYVAMGVAVVGGGVLAHTQRTKLVRILAAAVGGACVVLAVHIAWVRWGGTDEGVPPSVALAVLLVCTALGTALQTYLRTRERRGARARAQGQVERGVAVPVGVPV